MRAANPCSRNKKNCFCPISVFFLDVCDGAPSCWKVKGLSLKYFLALTAFMTFSVQKICSLPLPGQSSCTNQQPPQRGVRSPAPFGLDRNGCWLSRGLQLPRALPFIFSLCCPLNDRRRAAHSFFKIGRLFSLSFLLPLSCPSSSPHSPPSLDER